MQKPALIGVDIGTTNIKAVAFSMDGRELGKVSTPTITHHPRSDWAHFEADEIWEAISSSLRTLCRQLPADRVPAAIAFTSMAESAFALDAEGIPVHVAIAWFDRRTAPQTAWWHEVIGPEETARITGLSIKPLFGITKLMWIRENAPDAFARTTRWLHMADYGAYRLCGVQATDYSLASRTMVFDLARKEWSQTLLDKVGISAGLFAEVIPSGIQLGTVHAAAAAETGLPIGLPVVSGGHDHVCGALALGVTDPGDAFDSMGTAESLFIATERPLLRPELTTKGAGQGLHVAPDRGYAMGGIYFSGGCIDWIRAVLLQAGDQSFEQLIAQAGRAPAGSNGLFFLPHLRMANPPIIDIRSRGAFVGLSSDTTAGHFARAVLEGVAYEYHRAYEALVDSFQLKPNRIIAGGGGTRNRLLLEIKAALLGAPIQVAAVDEATCLGAAMLAGIGAGIYRDFSDAAERVTVPLKSVMPDAALHDLYQERYREVYLHLYNILRDTNHTISDNFVG